MSQSFIGVKWKQIPLSKCPSDIKIYFVTAPTLSNKLVAKGRILVSPANKIPKIMLKNGHFLIIFIILHFRGGTNRIPLYVITHIFNFFYTLSNRLVEEGRILVSAANKRQT